MTKNDENNERYYFGAATTNAVEFFGLWLGGGQRVGVHVGWWNSLDVLLVLMIFFGHFCDLLNVRWCCTRNFELVVSVWSYAFT